MISLIVLKDRKPLLKRSFSQEKIVIGRDEKADLQLVSPEISRIHCILRREENRILLKDLSRNGTFVNNVRVEEIELTAKDLIRIGTWDLAIADGSRCDGDETHVLEKSQDREEAGLLLGRSDKMEEVNRLIRKAGPSDVTICLIGETGTGKELAARSIHQLSARRDKPFLAINCGAIPDNLVESILFGHEKGSFTSAGDRHAGLFEEANRGTLFLDEIGEMPLKLQTRLLRVLETKTLRRVGGKNDIPVDVRLIAATNKDLKREILRGHFRQDLFYRLFVFPVLLWPLRERKEDIPLLVNHFLKELLPPGETKPVTQEALEKLISHSWPGNVRELKNTIQRGLLLAPENEIGEKDIELTGGPAADHKIGEIKLADQEKMALLDALKRSNGNKTCAAEMLGIARTTIASKLRRFKIEPEEWKR